MKPRLVLACSGSLESLVSIPWLAETRRVDVVALMLDMGGGEDFPGIRARALSVGAVRGHVLDVTNEFARMFILPALQSGACGSGAEPLAQPLAHALIARQLVEIAHIEAATMVACAGTRRDAARIARGVAGLDAALETISLAAVWGPTPAEAARYARSRAIAVSPEDELPRRVAGNLWGRSIQSDLLDDPWFPSSTTDSTAVTSGVVSPLPPVFVDIEFAAGVPIKVNGIAMPLVELIQSLETIAVAHGVGAVDVVWRDDDGHVDRRLHEAPAATLLAAAQADLSALVTAPAARRLGDDIATRYAAVIDAGDWFSPERDALAAFVASMQTRLTGVVRLHLFNGGCAVVARRQLGAQ